MHALQLLPNEHHVECSKNQSHACLWIPDMPLLSVGVPACLPPVGCNMFPGLAGPKVLQQECLADAKRIGGESWCV